MSPSIVFRNNEVFEWKQFPCTHTFVARKLRRRKNSAQTTLVTTRSILLIVAIGARAESTLSQKDSQSSQNELYSSHVTKEMSGMSSRHIFGAATMFDIVISKPRKGLVHDGCCCGVIFSMFVTVFQGYVYIVEKQCTQSVW